MCNRLIFLSIFLFLFFGSGVSSAAEALPENEILAKVGDKMLTLKTFTLMVEGMPPQYQAMVKNMPEVKNDLIRSWTDTTLLAEEALSTGVDKDPVIALKIEEMKNRIIVETLIASRIDTTTPISADETRTYYDSHPDEFIQGELVKAQHILIRTSQDSSPEDQEKAKEKINEILERLEAGDSFVELAKKFSEDPGSRDKGGDLGYFGKGHMVPDFEEAAFNTAVGQVCSPVQTLYGFHLIKVNDKTEPMKIPFEKISTKLEETLRAERNHKALQELLAELKEKYPVTIY
ncbi:MAG: peptidylprolyl isomerase [Desulfobulbaceae bacterium]|uniref:Peptidylprolyl isomerase n=1 Tax=Candidatus Desulfobia pelagia TaxID=2841692 RepID=A0A8J6NB46_9BACT|nr:peptidylprolyl isomerase [Candidatus Desulfobia pelagia]